MKILNITLENYIGIYNGMGINEISIDFTKCRNKITVIRGRNGSGKSTLFNAIHPLPDDNSSFIPGLPARKTITLQDNDIVYIVNIKHGVKDNGDRETTKAYMQKLSPLERIELNPNGNVTSFKEVLFDELSLDPNFVSLSQLSGEDRGLADKTPSERKKFVNSIMTSMEVYNNIHKVMTKRSSVFKSMINTIVSKIDNLGDESKLSIELGNISAMLELSVKERDSIIAKISELNTRVNMLDGSNEIRAKYRELQNSLSSTNGEISRLNISINNIKNKLGIDGSTDIDVLKAEMEAMINKLDVKLQVEKANISSLLTRREEDASLIQSKCVKLDTLKTGDIPELKRLKQVMMASLKEKEIIISSMKIDINNISKDEFIMGLNAVRDIKEAIDTLKSNMSYHTLQAVSEAYNNSVNVNNKVLELEKGIDEFIEEERMLESEHMKYTTLLSISKKLSDRPKGCNIDECVYIKDAVDASRQNPESMIKDIEAKLMINRNVTKQMKDKLNELREIVDGLFTLNNLIRSIKQSSGILNKLPIDNSILNPNKIADIIAIGYEFSELDVLYSHIINADIIEQYKLDQTKLANINSELDKLHGKQEIIEELVQDIDALNNKLDICNREIEGKNESINKMESKLIEMRAMMIEIKSIIDLSNKLLHRNSELEGTKNELSKIEKTMEEINKIMQDRDIVSKRLNELNNDIPAMEKNRNRIEYSLNSIEQYKIELADYQARYEKIETIKKFSSPNKGVQTIFMSLYMNKTIDLANSLLSLLFEGEYRLGQFEINETEFRIPCIGGGITNSDISSMSTSQICLISMILSFVLLQQSSTKYNILKLDEIDGGLDTYNRLKFVEVLNRVIDILQAENCIVISHNSEMNLSNCDVIQLRPVDNDITEEGNIIYKYGG